MKFLLLAALVFSGAQAFAQAPLTGRLNITVLKNEIIINNDKYEYKTDVVCKIKLPIATVDTRIDHTLPVLTDKTCRVDHLGKAYTIEAYYGSYIANKPLAPTLPKVDLLQFMAGFTATPDSGDSAFTPNNFSSFTTKDFNLKSAILEVYPNLEYNECKPNESCMPKAQTYLEAVYEYELN